MKKKWPTLIAMLLSLVGAVQGAFRWSLRRERQLRLWNSLRDCPEKIRL